MSREQSLSSSLTHLPRGLNSHPSDNAQPPCTAPSSSSTPSSLRSPLQLNFWFHFNSCPCCAGAPFTVLLFHTLPAYHYLVFFHNCTIFQLFLVAPAWHNSHPGGAVYLLSDPRPGAKWELASSSSPSLSRAAD